MARVYTIDVVTSASQSPIRRQRVEQANRVLGWPDGGFLLWLKRQLSACLFKPSQCQLCEILAILPFFFFFLHSSQCWWLAPYRPNKKQSLQQNNVPNKYFLSEVLFIFPQSAEISEFTMQTSLITAFKQMRKYIAIKCSLKGGLCKNFLRLKL